MTRTDETTELAKQAFWAILSGGRAPTVDLVNDWFLTNGHSKRNRNAISAALKSCWDQLGARVQQTRTIPDIPPETVSLVIALRDDLMRLATAQFAEDREAIIANSAEREAKARAEAAALDVALKAAEQKHASLLESFQKAGLRIEELGHTINELNQVAEGQRDRIAQLQVDLTESGAQLQHSQRQFHAAEREHVAAIAAEAARLKQTQHALQQQIDDERTRAARLTKQIEKQENTITALRDEATKRERLLSEQNSDLAGQVGKLQGMNTVLQQQLAQSQNDVEKRLNALTAATDKIAVLSTENAALKTVIAEHQAQTPPSLQALLEEAYLAGAMGQNQSKAGKKAASTTAEAIRPTANSYAAKIVDEM